MQEPGLEHRLGPLAPRGSSEPPASEDVHHTALDLSSPSTWLDLRGAPGTPPHPLRPAPGPTGAGTRDDSEEPLLPGEPGPRADKAANEGEQSVAQVPAHSTEHAHGGSRRPTIVSGTAVSVVSGWTGPELLRPLSRAVRPHTQQQAPDVRLPRAQGRVGGPARAAGSGEGPAAAAGVGSSRGRPTGVPCEPLSPGCTSSSGCPPPAGRAFQGLWAPRCVRGCRQGRRARRLEGSAAPCPLSAVRGHDGSPVGLRPPQHSSWAGAPAPGVAGEGRGVAEGVPREAGGKGRTRGGEGGRLMWTLACSPHLWATPCPVLCWGHSQGKGDCASRGVRGASGGQEEGPGPPQNAALGKSLPPDEPRVGACLGKMGPLLQGGHQESTSPSLSPFLSGSPRKTVEVHRRWGSLSRPHPSPWLREGAETLPFSVWEGLGRLSRNPYPWLKGTATLPAQPPG
ncbi:translation initiation factor IF-2-like isoform X2 [Pteropus vampyrus]|uniref:Translation initiation factor IF-2-like isoform X2 n=1 Tax=Pteropus vampyrus TaxID=132908 RepID=A0A6P6CNK7_PTEVA|nr:translation initiation factor IF-2-like isoform X2 [Pteropus vampyrus]